MNDQRPCQLWEYPRDKMQEVIHTMEEAWETQGRQNKQRKLQCKWSGKESKIVGTAKERYVASSEGWGQSDQVFHSNQAACKGRIWNAFDNPV